MRSDIGFVDRDFLTIKRTLTSLTVENVSATASGFFSCDV